MEGYFSPQLEVSVRLNANEAPEPPPPGFVAALQGEIDDVALNRDVVARSLLPVLTGSGAAPARVWRERSEV